MPIPNDFTALVRGLQATQVRHNSPYVAASNCVAIHGVSVYRSRYVSWFLLNWVMLFTELFSGLWSSLGKVFHRGYTVYRY